MKNLTLIRHAESHLQRPLEQDKERLLTPNGFHQVSTISKQLEKKNVGPIIYCAVLQNGRYKPQNSFVNI